MKIVIIISIYKIYNLYSCFFQVISVDNLVTKSVQSIILIHNLNRDDDFSLVYDYLQ